MLDPQKQSQTNSEFFTLNENNSCFKKPFEVERKNSKKSQNIDLQYLKEVSPLEYIITLYFDFDKDGNLWRHSDWDFPVIGINSALKPPSQSLCATGNTDAEVNKPFKFEGKLQLKLIFKFSRSDVLLHSKGLDILYAKAICQNGEVVYQSEKIEQISPDLVCFSFAHSLPAGHVVLELIYWGHVEMEEPEGLYLCNYSKKKDGGPEWWGLATHLEPAHCRKVFPCLDQPSAKAIFHLTVSGIPQEFSVLSNVELAHHEDHGPWRAYSTHYFNSTPPMSTYVFGLWIGKFQSTKVVTKQGVQIQAVVPAFESLQEASFALNVGCRAFEFLADIFTFPLPIQKLDLICLPKIYGLGMENFGAATFLRDFFLVGSNTDYSRKRRIARLICHEIVHQWHGNIVTPQSFDELWLKEGMARLFEYETVYYLEDADLSVWENFMSEVWFQSMIADAQPSSHPVVQEHHNDISLIQNSFDTITYGKGACLLRMLSFYLGKPSFILATQKYIERFQYHTATAFDLWTSMQEVVCPQFQIPEAMFQWLNRPGFPAVLVSLRGSKIVFEQRPFVLRESNYCGSEEFVPWSIPIRAKIIFQSGHCQYIHQLLTTKSLAVDLCDEYGGLENSHSIFYFIANRDHSGYYCTEIQGSVLWESSLRALAQGKMATEEMMGLVYDLILFVHESLAGQLHHHQQNLHKLFKRLSRITQILNHDHLHAAWYPAQQMVWELCTLRISNTLHRFKCQLGWAGHFNEKLKSIFQDELCLALQNLNEATEQITTQIHCIQNDVDIGNSKLKEAMLQLLSTKARLKDISEDWDKFVSTNKDRFDDTENNLYCALLLDERQSSSSDECCSRLSSTGTETFDEICVVPWKSEKMLSRSGSSFDAVICHAKRPPYK